MLPGARIYKTLIAVTISLILSRYILGLSGFYMTIAVVLSMKTDPQKSLIYGKNRIIGTLLGGILGYIIMVVIRHTPFISEDSIWMLFINVGCIFLLLWFSKLTHMSETGAALGCVIFFSITLIRFNAPIFDYVFIRVLETTIGVIIAMGVNYIKLPKSTTK
ncbi:uncharacterized membrane protein YgaE (UPF0421/DUF939 family) [Breznakia sp. PF5-3]|uniref:FUSC family protein n=1 Tax=unclassified Breznakia TaxID=2623764 RepID=UPI0024056420|nr:MULTISPECIES: FUSC family protein [unclassified Breznakia]MDL2276725.1 FUSC family protein [Breznakia sp. OttesenSCG-928-G09]MDF9825816.1 uncharacterized membrane protein YgaE (UPF0421/DUF939 family) [Breznakia sp. PM6-1]MDF9836621.1 uncharacterized membrane protein YgaE (UPF0421/DUF939 family) [Breznakia sp. PF5-3]MDF9838856.1 uncharacterized membrane protein YgaE (UPF0421/DUF939 family) [Breznakia sp. PFB2-8]MDF9860882.1 uncharacterized membrane protein YgaE (UPF0421/DUF939 family) [Brezn